MAVNNMLELARIYKREYADRVNRCELHESECTDTDLVLYAKVDGDWLSRPIHYPLCHDMEYVAKSKERMLLTWIGQIAAGNNMRHMVDADISTMHADPDYPRGPHLGITGSVGAYIMPLVNEAKIKEIDDELSRYYNPYFLALSNARRTKFMREHCITELRTKIKDAVSHGVTESEMTGIMREALVESVLRK